MRCGCGECRACGTRGSDIVSSAAGMLWMSVVRGMRGLGGLCEMRMCMCLAWGGVGGEGVSGQWGEWMRGLGYGFTNPVGTRGVGRLSVFGLRWCGWGVGRELGPGSGGVGWCYVCASCESGFSM